MTQKCQDKTLSSSLDLLGLALCERLPIGRVVKYRPTSLLRTLNVGVEKERLSDLTVVE